MYKILQKINSPKDLKSLSIADLKTLAQELRQFIIDEVSKKEGHLGASLGVVELTIALHQVFDTPYEPLIWDVGHQAYGHKILTERKNFFHTNRSLGGISGFPKRSESIYDSFGTGHSSTSLSAILGMALASELKGINKTHIAVIGDASISSGMAFEALNHLGVTNANVLIILNDNTMGIDPSVGALKEYLIKIRDKSIESNQNVFQALNINYCGPIDGHDLPQLVETLKVMKSQKGPRLLHVLTTKGKGLELAERHQVLYHAPGKFDPLTGKLAAEEHQNLPPKFQDVFGLTIKEIMEKHTDVVAITPAMPTGSGLKTTMDAFPNRVFDVGIAEQHAVTLAAGMACEGLKVFCAIYSTFLQRAVDQVIHDVTLQNLPIIFCLDRAGLVGEDGATHHGVFDMALLLPIPNLAIFAPLDEVELRQMLHHALTFERPLAIRYPRGRGIHQNWQIPFKKINPFQAKWLSKGKKVAVLSTGFIGQNVIKAFEILQLQHVFTHVHFLSIKPLDETSLHVLFYSHEKFITIEDGCKTNGFGQQVNLFKNDHDYQQPIEIMGVPDYFIEHGTINELQQICQIDVNTLVNRLSQLLS